MLNKPFTLIHKFDDAVEKLHLVEGGFQKHYNDKGNWTSGKIGVGRLLGTKYGISAARYPNEDIINLTKERAKYLYRRDYWDKYKCDEIPTLYRYFYFDCFVNHSPRAAVKIFQGALNDSGFDLKEDGILGNNTLNAIKTMKLKTENLRARRIAYFSELCINDPNNYVFLVGWINRVLSI